MNPDLRSTRLYRDVGKKVFIVHYKSQLILTALVTEILFSPSTESHPHFGALTALVKLGLLLTLLRYTAPSWLLKLLIPFACVWFGARLLEAMNWRQVFSAQIASVAGLAIFLSVLGLMLRRFRVLGVSSTNLIAEGIICYLLIAICFSEVYEISIALPCTRFLTLSRHQGEAHCCISVWRHLPASARAISMLKTRTSKCSLRLRASRASFIWRSL